MSINATIAVDLLGQCASETVAGAYYSSSGGQADFARGAMYSTGGQGFVVLPRRPRTTPSRRSCPSSRRRRRHDAEEHRRQGRHRVGRRRAARPLPARAGPRPDRHRPPRPPRPPPCRSNDARLPLTLDAHPAAGTAPIPGFGADSVRTSRQRAVRASPLSAWPGHPRRAAELRQLSRSTLAARGRLGRWWARDLACAPRHASGGSAIAELAVSRQAPPERRR